MKIEDWKLNLPRVSINSGQVQALAEQRLFILDPAGDDVETPSPARDVVDGRAALRKMDRMESVGDVSGRKQHDPAGYLRQRRRGTHKIEPIFVKAGDAAMP
ncbi:MAG TPA: hypothetical protein VMV27_17155 [Candidatus Binataceae bacterium]|nr:hypothetical protein [Candidatus Binataceae bacterium]